MKIIIHLGLTKTGTTAIQRFLDKNSEKLVELGFYYPKFEEVRFENYRSSGNGYGLYLDVIAKSINPLLLKETVCNWLGGQCRRAESMGCDNLIISSEAFCTLSEDNLKLLISSLPENEIVYEFIIFRREPYAWFFSSWLQMVKREGLDKWLDRALLDDIDFSLRPLLAENIIRENGFDSSVRALDYDLCKDRVVKAFLGAINVDEADCHDFEFLRDSGVSNRSLSRRDFIVQYRVNKLSKRNVELSELFHSLISDDCQSPPFFFLDIKVVDAIYEYCAINGVRVDESRSRVINKLTRRGAFGWLLKLFCAKRAALTEEIRSETAFLSSLTNDEIYFLDSIDVAVKFYADIFNKTRELVIHKINLYSSSEYRKLVPDDFSAFVYLTLNDDVLYSHIDPYKHYCEFGIIDQRVFSENMLISPDFFSGAQN